jgi:hypothetical protein
MSELFNLDEIKKQPTRVEDKSAILVERFLDAHDHKIESIKNLAGKLPEEGEIYFLWTMKSFNAFTFIPYIIKAAGVIDELHIATYSISIRIVDALVKLLEHKKVNQVSLLISDSLKYRLPRVHDHLQALTANRKEIAVKYAWNHSKIALIRVGEEFYGVEGSGNFGENAQHEQYIFYRSKNIFQFRKEEIGGIHS